MKQKGGRRRRWFKKKNRGRRGANQRGEQREEEEPLLFYPLLLHAKVTSLAKDTPGSDFNIQIVTPFIDISVALYTT